MPSRFRAGVGFARGRFAGGGLVAAGIALLIFVASACSQDDDNEGAENVAASDDNISTSEGDGAGDAGEGGTGAGGAAGAANQDGINQDGINPDGINQGDANQGDASSQFHISESPIQLDYEIVGTYSHDTERFTQGLLYHEGNLYESTGLVGESVLWSTDLASLRPFIEIPDDASDTDDADGTGTDDTDTDSTGTEDDSQIVEIGVDAKPEYFGEGLARVDDTLVWLTWKAGVATRYHIDTLMPVETYEYEGEGWGLCFNGAQLVKSDGSNRLTYLTKDQLTETGEVEVADYFVGEAILGGVPDDEMRVSEGAGGGREAVPVWSLNELECVDDLVWANVWKTDQILVIDPSRGEVIAVADMAGLLSPHPADTDRDAVLNGIAYRPDTDTFLLTGKRWPTIFEVRFNTETLAQR